MTLQIDTYVRKPFTVDAVQVTPENMREVAKWCKGKLKEATENSDGTKSEAFILVQVHNAATDRHKQAYPGDWIFYSKNTGHKVYKDRAFNGSFDKQVVYTEADSKAQLEEGRNDTKPEISVAEVLVKEFNASHGVPEKAQTGTDDVHYRSAVDGQFVSEEFAEENPDTTVAERDTAGVLLSPEDQERLSS